MIKAGRWLLLILLVRWTAIFLLWPMRQDVVGASFLHLPNLIFHEAGHFLFAPFGEFMMTLGGSLNQVLIPIVCMIAFLTPASYNLYGAAVMLWWAGENMLDVAIYMNDARSLQLMLLGGPADEVEGHDWEKLLTMTNSLHLDHRIAWTTHWIGAAMMFAGIIWGAAVALNTSEDE
jgi:hypothetical protein